MNKSFIIYSYEKKSPKDPLGVLWDFFVYKKDIGGVKRENVYI